MGTDGARSGRTGSAAERAAQASHRPAPPTPPEPQSDHALIEALATVDATRLDAIRSDLRRNLDTVHHLVRRPPSLPLLELLDALDLAAACRADATSASDPTPLLPMLLPVSAASALAGTSPSTMRKRIERGLVPGARKVGGIWMIPTADVPALRRRSA